LKDNRIKTEQGNHLQPQKFILVVGMKIAFLIFFNKNVYQQQFGGILSSFPF
jgi:hypothetical protein